MTQLLQNAAYGTALILAVAALRRLLKDRLIPEARLALWAVCLFRLLTPAAPESALSLWGLFAKPAPAPVQAPQLYIPAPTLNSAPAPQPSAPGFSWEMALGLAWLAAGLALAARYVLIWRRTRRAVACAIPLGRDDPRYAPLPKCARLREGVMEGAPLTFGAVRPTVVLSPGLEGAELDCVLAHEGVHARRRDNLWHYAMALVLTIHWWNPAVWLMSRLLRRDIELSCDRAAVRRLGENRRAEYAQALVTLATQDAGPAFCQTFGRKAAEERILSIMKFKKTSIIGVIFSLALVLAVTAAFASEPKEPDEYDSVKTGSSQTVMVPLPDKTKEVQSGFPEIDPDDVNLSELEEMLDKKVAGGQLTRQEADQRLADTEAVLERARRGELKLFWYDNGGGENWVYGVGVFQVNGETQSRFVDPGQILQPLYYEDENGKLVPVDPDTVINGYVLVSDTSYVEEGEDLVDTTGQLLGVANIKYDEGKTVTDYDVKLPTFDEDGNPVNNSVIGARYPDYVVEDGAEAAGEIGSQFYSYQIRSSDGGTVRTSSGVYTLCSDKSCDVSYDHCHIDGKVVRAYYQYPGLLCAQPDCTNEEPHQHNGVQYAGKAGSFVVLPRNPGFPSSAGSTSIDPVFVEDGDPVPSPDNGPIITEQDNTPVEHPVPMTLEQYKALLDGLVSKGRMSREEADGMLSSAQEHMKGQEFPYLWAIESNGSYMVTGRPKLCTQTGCHNNGVHAHDGVYYTGCASQNSAPVPSVAPVSPNTSDDLPQFVNTSAHHSAGHHSDSHHH